MLYCARRRPLYIGSARNLKHRLQSYYEADDFAAHPTKLPLRMEAVYFDYKVMPLTAARKLERGIKWKKMPEHNRR